MSAREGDQRAVQYRAVVRQVVAAQYRERRHALRAPAPQAFDDPADGAARLCRVRQIVRDVGVGGIELIVRIEAVALFGDGERDDARIARGEARECRVGVRRAHQQLADRADDARARRGAELHQRVQALLRRQRVAQARALERQRGDRPALVGVQQRVDVVRLVRAMKRARADVHDPEARGAAVVGGKDRARTNGMQARLGEARRTHQDLAI